MLERSCPQLERVREWLLGDLEGPQVGAVEQHAAACPVCREEVEAWQLVERVVRESDPYPDPGPVHWARFGAALRQACVGD